MKILILGDFVKNQLENIVLSKRLKSYIKGFDNVVLNLEGPLISGEKCKIIKAGPHVRNSCEATRAFKELGVTVALLANNHIMDYGVYGLKETEQVLADYSIKSVGVGSFEECYKPLVIDECSIINVSQLEFGGIKEKQDGFGFAWIRHEKVFEAIMEEKKRGQYCIVIPHAGLENEIIPLPEIRKLYKDYINCGADIVVGGHPHIIQGMEVLNKKAIYYSLGNLWFDTEVLCNHNEWNRSLIVSIDTDNGKYSQLFIKRDSGMLDFDDSCETNIDFENRCDLLRDENEYYLEVNRMVERVWNDYYKKCYLMLPPFSAENIWGNIFNIARSVLRPRKRVFDETMLLHNIQIEPHLWCVERYLRNKNRKDNIDLLVKSVNGD